MRISDLSKESGVTVPTIKFYIRERLVAPGEPTARNQAMYDKSHVARLRLIRTLIEVGQLSLSSVREVLTAIDNKRLSVQGLCKAVNRALFAGQQSPDQDEGTTERHEVNQFICGLGWLVEDEAAGRTTLVQVLIALRRLGCDADVRIFEPFAQAAGRFAAQDAEHVNAVEADCELDTVTLVARMVLCEVAFAAIRRMAYDHHLSLRFAEAGHAGGSESHRSTGSTGSAGLPAAG